MGIQSQLAFERESLTLGTFPTEEWKYALNSYVKRFLGSRHRGRHVPGEAKRSTKSGEASGCR